MAEYVWVFVAMCAGVEEITEVFSTQEGALAYERDIAREEYDLAPEPDGTVDWDKLSDLHDSPYAAVWTVTKDVRTGEWGSSERNVHSLATEE